jgi:hypothetical protein
VRETAFAAKAHGVEGEMRIPGPYSDDTWDWLPQDKSGSKTTHKPRGANSASRVAWEMGLALLVPLAGVGAVELVLNALHVY